MNERTAEQQSDPAVAEPAAPQTPQWEPTPFVRDHGSLFSDQLRRP